MGFKKREFPCSRSHLYVYEYGLLMNSTRMGSFCIGRVFKQPMYKYNRQTQVKQHHFTFLLVTNE